MYCPPDKRPSCGTIALCDHWHYTLVWVNGELSIFLKEVAGVSGPQLGTTKSLTVFRVGFAHTDDK